MDIADLAPALMGISELCKIANKRFNGDRSTVKVLIRADIEQQCIQFDLQVVQSIWDQTRSLLSNSDVTSAKELLEWLGIVGCVGGVVGVIGVIKWLRGRSMDAEELEYTTEKNITRISVTGSNNVIIAHSQAVELMREEQVLSNIKKVVKPVTKEGYESLEFESKNSTEKVTKDEAALITALQPQANSSLEDQPQTITAWVTVYSPVYDKSAQNWRFKFGDVQEYMDISETDIAEKALARGGALVDDAYKIRLELRQELKPGGKITNYYKIMEVLDFRGATIPTQRNIFEEKNEL